MYEKVIFKHTKTDNMDVSFYHPKINYRSMKLFYPTCFRQILLVVVGVLIITTSIDAQNYLLDTTFQSEFKFRSIGNTWTDSITGIVGTVIPLPDESILCFGSFKDHIASPYYYRHLIRLSKYGEINHSYNYSGAGNDFGLSGKIAGDTVYQMVWISLNKTEATTGIVDANFYNNAWLGNWRASFADFLVYPDGSILTVGFISVNQGLPSYKKTHIAKIHWDGTYDTTFNHNSDDAISRTLRYDDDRVLISGRFTMYDSTPAYKMARIYNDGTLDTTFKSIFITPPKPKFVDQQGRVIVGGLFQIENYPYYLGMVRILADGSLDSTFNNFNNSHANSGLWSDLFTQFIHEEEYTIMSVCPTPIGKYLVGGIFINYQGYSVKRLALVDQNGFLDTLSPFLHIDTCYNCGNAVGVGEIKAIDGDCYYVSGHFSGFRGQDVEPVIRICNASNNVQEIKKMDLEVFPIPASDFITVNLPSLSKTITVHDLLGNPKYSSDLLIGEQQHRIDCRNWPNGVYICTITDANHTIYSHKILIVH